MTQQNSQSSKIYASCDKNHETVTKLNICVKAKNKAMIFVNKNHSFINIILKIVILRLRLLLRYQRF